MWPWRKHPWRAALAQAARGFDCVRAGSAVLRVDPAIDRFEASLFRLACQQEVAAVERLFGARLHNWRTSPRRLQVYVFQSASDVSQLYGERVDGFASCCDWQVAVNFETEWSEILRHEITHIFGGLWNPYAPRVLCEGLAMWAQRTIDRRPLDDYLRYFNNKNALEILLGPEPKSSEFAHAHYYALAGSFSAALIERYGLAAYRRLYRDRGVQPTELTVRLRKHFGATAPAVVQEWLSGLGDDRRWGFDELVVGRTTD